MFKSAVFTAMSVCLVLSASFTTPRVAAMQADHVQQHASAPSFKPKLWDKFSAVDKTSQPARVTSARITAAQDLEPGVRAAQFATRASADHAEHKPGATADLPTRLQLHHPHLSADAKTAAFPAFVGRHGTGLGDIIESSSGDDPDLAQIVDDLPANVIGDIDDPDDVDFYAITATSGEIIRVEVTADRIFGSPLDSYLYLVDDEDRVLATNDDGFGTSDDSFIEFRATYTGDYFIGVTDSDGDGGFDFDYVLSLSASREDIDEDESNDTLDRADALPVPSTAFGRSNDDQDQDVYRFKGVADQALVVDVDADIFLSDADMVVEFYDSQGGLLFASDDVDGRDPRFNIVLPYTGRYYLVVYDLNRARGSDGHYYSMNVSTQNADLAPRATSYKTSAGRLLSVRGTNFDPSGVGSKAEIDAELQPSFNVPTQPTTKVKLSPTGFLSGSDSITVVNPDGRRSNPIVLR